jgi:hypothetical protein
MKFLTNNRILKNTIFGLLVALVLLAPLSLGVGVGGGERSGDAFTTAPITLSTSVTLAAGQAAVSTAQTTLPIGELNFEQRAGVLVMEIAAWFSGISGLLLHISMTELVVGMGELIVHKGFGEAINANWAVIRDICNLVFIFGFIYIGIRTIIDYDSPTTKRFLSQIIIGALLINFSLFITKAVIDFSNFTALQIYETMAPEEGAGIAQAQAGEHNVGIAAQYANLMGLSGIYNSGSWGDSGDDAQRPAYASFWFYLVASVVLMVAAFVFAAGAVLLIVRFAALVLIMIFSPLLFAATVFPATAKHASNLWKQLFSYAFFAPVYFFLLLLSGKVLEKSKFALTDNNNLGSGIAQPGVESVTILLNFFLVIFFLILSLKIAQSMGVKGGDMAVSVGKDLKNKSQRAMGTVVVGGSAAFARGTMGQGAHRLAETNKFKDLASKNWIAKQALKGTRAVGGASFDARSVGGVGKKLGIGDAHKGGYTDDLKKRTDAEKKFADSLGNDKGAIKAAEDAGKEAIKNAAENQKLVEQQLKDGTANARGDLLSLSRELRIATTDADKLRLSGEINAKKAEIEQIEHQFAPQLNQAKEAVAKAVEKQKTDMAKAKSARQIAYSEQIRDGGLPRIEFFRYGNNSVADAIKDASGKEKSDNDKLLEEIKKLKSS